MYFGGGMATFDIILPAYNPLPGWEELVIDRFLSLENQMPDQQFHLIIVNDGSSRIIEDESLQILKRGIPALQWISYTPNKGKGYALRKGVESSNSEHILYTDIDWPYTQESMANLIISLLTSADAVIGVRDEGYYAHLPPSRRQISKWLKRINARFLKLKVHDTQAGLKGFKKKVKPVFLSTTIDRYLFDLEFIYLLSKKEDLKVIGQPIKLREGITFSKMNRKILFHEARNFLKIWLKS